MQKAQAIKENPYSTNIINKSTQKQLIQMLKRFRREQLPWWKLGAFIGYNFLALSGMLLYAYSFKSKRVKPGVKGKIPQSQLNLLNIIKRGSIHGTIIGGLYIAGWFLIIPYTLSVQNFQKYNEIESALYAFTVRFDPYYQQHLLFMKMRQFGLSSKLISDIKQDINQSKIKMIQEGSLTEKSIKVIEKSTVWFQKNFKFNQNQFNLVKNNKENTQIKQNKVEKADEKA